MLLEEDVQVIYKKSDEEWGLYGMVIDRWAFFASGYDV